MAQNFIKVFMGIDLAFVSVDNDIIVGRSHLANRVELITPVALGTNDVMQIFFELANGQTTPKRVMLDTGGTEQVNGDDFNVYRFDIPQSVLSAITSNKASTIKVQFRKATIADNIVQQLQTSAQVTLSLDAAFTPNADDEVIEVDEFDALSGLITEKLNKNFSGFTVKTVPDDNDLIAIDEGAGTNKKVTVGTIVAAATDRVADLQTSIDTLQEFVDQDVSIGSNPAFASPTVTSVNFLSNGQTSTIDFTDAEAVNATASHIASTDNPHSVTAEQVGLGDADNTSDADKPISDDTQTALDDKQDELFSGTNIKSINGATILASGDLELIAASEKGVTVATLVSGKVPASQLPAFVDDLEEYANFAAFPAIQDAESDKIYVAIDTGKIFRFSGSQYVEIAANEVNSVNNKTGVVTLDKTDIGLGNVANAAQVTAVTATAPIESTGGTTPTISIVAATDQVDGSMSAADKTKLDAIAASTLDTDVTNFGGILSATEDTVQKALDVLDDHDHTVADITNLSATVVPYDNTGQNLVATDVQAAINEIDDLVEEGLTQVVVTKFEITDDDDGTGGFTFTRNGDANITGTKDTGKFVFTLPSGIEYVTGSNRLVVKIDGSDGALKRLFYGADDELSEPSDTTFAIDFALVTGDVLYAQLFQSLATVSLDIADGSVTESKLATDAVTTVKLANNNVTLAKVEQIATNTMLGNDTGDTANVKSLTAAEAKVLLELNNVDNTTDLNKPISTNTQTALDAKVTGAASAVAEHVATFNGTTGKLIKDSGFTIETSVPENAVFTDTGEDNVIEIVQAEGTPLAITDKTVNVTRSALGAGTGDANVVFLTTTIAAVDFTGSVAPFTAVKTINGILATDRPIVDLDLSSVAIGDVAAKQSDFALIFRAAATDANEMSFFATDEPTEELVVAIKVVR